jgi:septal ring factor EnvC (AmiA/AmiB activator)
VDGSSGLVDWFWRAVTVGFRGFLPLQQQTNRKLTQQQTSTNHRNKKLTIITTQKKKKKQQIHQYWIELEKLKVVPQQNQRGLAKIRRHLTRFGEISPDLARSHQIR